MNKSEILYKGLINQGKDRITEFFKNVTLFESQFSYADVNQGCFKEMYSTLEVCEQYPARQSFFEKIPDLEIECKKCYKYFMQHRNKFVKGYDIQLGKLLEEVFIDYFKTQSINIVRADLKDRRYPDLLILDRSKEIIGYIELKYHASPFLLAYRMRPGRECYEGSLTLDKEKVAKQLKIIFSELDRPVFYVHWVDFPCMKGIFYQTSEQLHEILLAGSDEYYRKTREGDFVERKDGTVKKVGYSEKFYPSIIEMGSFEELIKTINANK
jgi:hypothetical protein